MKNSVGNIFKQPITKEQSKDTGMAMVLLLLLIASTTKRQSLVAAAIVVLIIDMTVPIVFKPVAVVWLGLSHLMGSVMSRILLTIVFFGIVTPLGLIRRALGHDSLKLRTFKAGDESVMWARNHTFTGRDIEKPY